MRFQTKYFKSVSEFVSELIKDLKDCQGPVWFRGQSDKGWGLLPTIVREKKLAKEMEFIRQFKQSATLLVSPHPQKLIDWLFIMQHHGVPTRLLDWTESPLMAAYFAVRENEQSDGAVWAILPVGLNKEARVDNIPSFDEDAILSPYKPEELISKKMPKLLPVGIIAPRNNTRMQAQLSVFTINHKVNIPIEKIGSRNHVWRYIVRKEYKADISSELNAIGIGKFQLFPELQSIGDILKEGV